MLLENLDRKGSELGRLKKSNAGVEKEVRSLECQFPGIIEHGMSELGGMLGTKNDRTRKDIRQNSL